MNSCFVSMRMLLNKKDILSLCDEEPYPRSHEYALYRAAVRALAWMQRLGLTITLTRIRLDLGSDSRAK